MIKAGILVGMHFQKVEAHYDEEGKRSLLPTDEPPVFIPCDQVLLAVGQQNAYPFLDVDLEMNKWGLPVLDEITHQSSIPNLFFGGDAAFGPKNVITAVAHGHEVAISIDLYCQNKDLHDRPEPITTLISQKMGLQEWLYNSHISDDERYAVPTADKVKSLKNRLMEVELGFSKLTGHQEALRCLNCDVQTVFDAATCIECDACVDICPESCINFITNASENELRNNVQIPADNKEQSLYVSEPLPTGRVMVKDENVCLHCGLCAERCPTSSWEMMKFTFKSAQVGPK